MYVCMYVFVAVLKRMDFMNAAIWIPDGLLRFVQSVAACGWRNFGVVPRCDYFWLVSRGSPIGLL